MGHKVGGLIPGRSVVVVVAVSAAGLIAANLVLTAQAFVLLLKHCAVQGASIVLLGYFHRWMQAEI